MASHINVKTRVSNNSLVTDIFKPSRVPYDCPLFPYNCIIYAEIMACLYRDYANQEGMCVNNIKKYYYSITR